MNYLNVNTVDELERMLEKDNDICTSTLHSEEFLSLFNTEKYLKELPEKDYVWDEDKSVRWNREKTVETIERYEDENREVKSKLYDLYEGILMKVYAREYDLNMEQARVIYDYAYSEGHAYGASEIQGIFTDIVVLVHNVNEIK